MRSSTNCFNELVLSAPRRLAMPVAVYPGLALTGGKVQEVVHDSLAQYEASVAVHRRYQTPFVLSAMDLSAEAEAFGCQISFSEGEVPSVTGRLVTNLDEARQLRVPGPGEARTGVYLETVRQLHRLPERPLVLGGCIGPFSLAARLVGVSEAMELTVTEPEIMHVLLEKCVAFLAAYGKAFREAGADAVLMAEPAAGLLSPKGMSAFSSAYVRQIGAALADGRFALVSHNCAAKLLHLPAVLETGLTTFHFGAPMDLPAALAKVPPEVVLCGNLDPSGVFCQASAEEARAKTRALLQATATFRNYVVSSGCDIPPGSKLANLDAFYEAVKESGARA